MNTDQKGHWLQWLLLPLLVILLPIVAIAALLWMFGRTLLRLLLLIAVWALWLPRGKDALLVYSRSPHWMEYFESGLIPQLQRRAVILNWSDRSRWSLFDLPVWVFRAFQGERSFNPMVLVFRPFRWPTSFRYYEAFKHCKHGNERPLRDLEAELNAHLKMS